MTKRRSSFALSGLYAAAPRALFCVVLCSLLFTGCDSKQNEPMYVTWKSREPDVWASIWLLNKAHDGRVDVVLKETGTEIVAGVPFAVPSAQLRRTAEGSTFESLLTHLDQTDPVMMRIGTIIRALEVTRWTGADVWEAEIVELHFRHMQLQRLGNVSSSCYKEFFDRLYAELANADQTTTQTRLEVALSDTDLCDTNAALMTREETRAEVKQIPIDDVLAQIAAGNKVIFVDAREQGEFQEERIPGAINMTLRDVLDGVEDQFAGADLVISYCIKDFRGFEVAQALARQGVQPVGTMNPHGFAGWIAAKLPVASDDGMSDQVALAHLQSCAKESSLCR